MISIRLVPIAFALALLASCGTNVVNPVTGQTERSVMDERTELAEGKKAHAEVIKGYGVYPDARLQAYVNGIGQKLASQSHRANIPWTFTVLDSPDINAFALPGGYVYITRGILAYMESEADMAGVIGHEIGHVTARHGAQRATRQQNAGLGVLAATVLGAVLESQGVTDATQTAGQLAQSAAAGYVATYSREQELQADTLGAEYLARSRYNPQNMVDVIQVLKSQESFAADMAKAEGKAAPRRDSWLSSHPSNDQRLQSIRLNAAQYKGQYGDDGRDRYLQMVNGLRFGENPDQGLTRGQDFYHVPLGIAMTAPAGWRIQNAVEALTFVNATGDAALRVLAVPPSAGTAHEDIIRNTLKPSQGRASRGTINGFAATHFVGTRQASNGQVQPVEATLVTGPKQVNFLMVYLGSDAAAVQRARSGLSAAEQSFRPLSRADAQAARPWIVRLVPYPRGGFPALQKAYPVESAGGERQLRLLNGAYGSGTEPRVGQQVKVIAVQ
jgi:predicted Zn-dependent protease